MNYDNLERFMNELKKEVKITRLKYVYDVIKHDQEIKSWLNVKKLRKTHLLSYFKHGIMIGQGSIQALSSEDIKPIIEKIKFRLRQ